MFFFVAVLSMKPSAYLKGLDHVSSEAKDEFPLFFNMPVLMLMLITLLNDGTLISIGYDTVKPSPLPQRWNLRVLFTIAITLGIIPCLSSLALLHSALNSWNPDGIFQKWGVHDGLRYGQIITMIYLKVCQVLNEQFKQI
jgi:H+-transporting ATPase